MQHWKSLNDYLGGAPEDIKAEAVLAHLANWKKSGGWYFWPNGGFHRSVRRDVHKIKEVDDKLPHTDSAVIELNRKGLYDLFPEGMWHKPRKSKPFKKAAELKDDVDYNDELESNARKLFWPLDHELLAMRMAIYQNENDIYSGLEGGYAAGILKFWQIDDLFSRNEKLLLTVFLPHARVISSKLEYISTVLSIILKVDMAVNKTLVSRKHIANNTYALGEMPLGTESILGCSMEDTGYELQIRVGPLNKQMANNFSVGQSNLLKLNRLCAYFCPVDIPFSIVLLHQSEIYFTLGEENGEESRLGVTSILN